MDNNTVEIIIENCNQRVQFPQGADLRSIADEYQSACRFPIIGALVNNELHSLNYHIYTPKSIRFVDVANKNGYRMYKSSLTFMLYKAVRDVYPKAHLTIEHSLLNGFYCKIDQNPADPEQSPAIALLNPTETEPDKNVDVARKVRNRMVELRNDDLPFTTRHMLLTDALELIKNEGIPETYRLLSGLGQLYVTMNFLDGTPHKLDSTLVPSTGHLKVWDFRIFEEGFLLQCPDHEHPEVLSLYQDTPKLFSIFQEHHRWANLLHVPNVEDLNREVHNGNTCHLIHVAEALHEKKYATIADAINQRRDTVKMVLLAGPSSSGKTTSCRRLAVQLSVLGFDVQQMSLDDYFVDRSRTPKQPNGEYDFEALEALDIPLLNEHLLRLFEGEKVDIPTYDFISGAPHFGDKSLQMKENSILIVEGIHALNPKLTSQIAEELKFKVYVSALTQISIDDQNIIHSSDNRLIRRIVRDNNYRGYSAHNTLKRWDSVRHGEELHIFPYQENADMMFNSALLYELGILKTFAEPLLKKVPENAIEYAEASRLLNFIELIEPIDPKYIPPTSILREFLGGSSFEY